MKRVCYYYYNNNEDMKFIGDCLVGRLDFIIIPRLVDTREPILLENGHLIKGKDNIKEYINNHPDLPGF